MKTFVLLVLTAWFNMTLGQFTPNCTDISARATYEPPLTQAQINTFNSQQQSLFPNAIKLEEPTSSYNCHNYAFVKSEGGAEFWLTTPGDDAFWNDGSYVTTTNISQANLKISYQGDHSAVTTGTPNQAISKWGAWGLYKHNITDVPVQYLPNNTLTYYRKKPLISGSSLICTSETFGLIDQPAGSSVVWASSNSSLLSIHSTTGAATRQNYTLSGAVTLTATISNTCGSHILVM